MLQRSELREGEEEEARVPSDDVGSQLTVKPINKKRRGFLTNYPPAHSRTPNEMIRFFLFGFVFLAKNRDVGQTK